MIIDFSRCPLPPLAHQREDAQWLADQKWALLASEPRTGKTKIVVDAAHALFDAGAIDRVVVVAPAPVRDVWFDETLGEIKKHAWRSLNHRVVEFHARVREWECGAPERQLLWVVTNYEFLRSVGRLRQLKALCGARTLLVGDESSFLKNHAAQQTKAFKELRAVCGRVWLLNGTPIYHSPLDLFSQGNLLHPSVLDCKYITHFKARYAVQEPVLTFGGKPLDNGYGRPVMKITGWANLDDLQRRFASCTRRRLQKDCLDMVPEKLAPVALTAMLAPDVWRHYKNMRDELVVWLEDGRVATAAAAAVKVMRLSQITSGFLGGVEEAGIDDAEPQDALIESLDLGSLSGQSLPGIVRDIEDTLLASGIGVQVNRVQEIGREKLDVLLWFVAKRLVDDPQAKIVAWSRFRAEALRAERVVKAKFPQCETALVLGGQKKAERLRALALLKPETAPKGPVFVAGVEGTGSFGLDMSASHTCVTLSSGYSPGKAAQTSDRVYGPGQTHAVAYYDIIAYGPHGQKTIDHAIVAARRAGEDVASWTSAAWVKALKEL